MRPVESGDFATHIERELGAPPGKVLPPVTQARTSSKITERVMVALLALLAVATFAGVGIIAIVTGISSGVNRYTGEAFVLTGLNATLTGLLAISIAAIFNSVFLRQLPIRLRKGACFAVAAMGITALTYAFGVIPR